MIAERKDMDGYDWGPLPTEIGEAGVEVDGKWWTASDIRKLLAELDDVRSKLRLLSLVTDRY